MAANQSNSLLKLNQFAKDMNMKSKDVITILEEKGIAAKTQKALEPNEFEILFETLTKNNQITNIEDYLDGITYIPSKKAAAEKKAETPKSEVPVKEAVKETVAEAKSEAENAAEDKGEKVEKTETKEEKKKENTEKKTEAPKAPVEAKKPEEKKPVDTKPVEKKPEQSKAAPAAERTQDNDRFQSRPQREGGAPQQRNDRFAGNGQQRSDRPSNDRFGQGGYAQKPQGDRAGSFGGQQRFDKSMGGQRPDNRAGGFNQRPDNKAGGFGGGQFKDKDERVQSGPKDTFKRQEIVRTQSSDAPKQRGATRVVDTRASSVDLSKYDERLDNFVPDSIGDVRGGNQKLKKQNNAAKGASPMGMNKNNNKQKGKKSSQPVTKAPTSVTLPSELVVNELASRLMVTTGEIIKRLMMLGMMVTANQTIDYETAAIVAEEMGITATQEVVVTIEEKLFEEEEDNETNLVPRAPVVCVMGHVDHGKTSILDAIRHTRVTTGEAGGITQHIGAYRVKVNGQDITFLDTPGHEAFAAMRARGAQATDIAILVVAADDGIMPQTVEAINHAKAAGIDIVVAINKMDKPTANPDNVKQELTKYDLVPEEWGGDVICVPVSALTGQGIDDLLENVLLVAEVKELKANPNRRAKGIVIEAKLDKGRGPVATVLVQSGTLHNGDIVIAGTSVGRVRAMSDHNGKPVKAATPSVPVEIIGLAEVPSSGDEFNAVEDERMARTLADQRREKAKEEVFKANARANLNDLFAQISEGVKELNIIVKADVDGSVEAVRQSLEKISNDEVKVRVIHAATGGIREGDVMLAAASNAIIVGFNVRPDKGAIDSAERQNVEIRTYRVIYDCINEITDAMKGMLAPEFRESLLGHAEVRQTIHVPNVGTIAGSYVQDGKVTRASMIRVVRDGIVIFEDKISSLKRFKDDVREVAQGYECGIGLERFNDIKVGDILEAYIMEEIKR